MAIFTTGRETDDLYLVAALLRMGINLDPKLPFRTFEPKNARTPKFVFYFQERSACGKFLTEQLIKVWDDPKWMEDHPDHPWCYLWGMARYHQEVLAIVKNAGPLAEVEHGGLTGFLSLHASQEQQDKFFRRLSEMRRRGRRSRINR